MLFRDHTKKIDRFPLSIETVAFIVVNQTPNGKSIKRMTDVPEAFIRYCLLKSIHN